METKNINYGNLIDNLDNILYNKQNIDIISEDDDGNEIIIGKKNIYPYLFRMQLNDNRDNFKYLFGNPDIYSLLNYYYGYLLYNDIVKYTDINDITNNLELILKKSFDEDLNYFKELFDKNSLKSIDYFSDLINSISSVTFRLRKRLINYTENIMYIYNNFYRDYNELKKKALKIQELDGPEILLERIENELKIAENFTLDDFKAIYCVNTSMFINYIREFRFLNEEMYYNERLTQLELDKNIFIVNSGISFIRYWIDLQDMKKILIIYDKILESYEVISSFKPTHMLKMKFGYLYDSWQNGKSEIDINIKQLEQLLEIFITYMNDTLVIIMPLYMDYYNKKYKEE